MNASSKLKHRRGSAGPPGAGSRPAQCSVTSYHPNPPWPVYSGSLQTHLDYLQCSFRAERRASSLSWSGEPQKPPWFKDSEELTGLQPTEALT